MAESAHADQVSYLRGQSDSIDLMLFSVGQAVGLSVDNQ